MFLDSSDLDQFDHWLVSWNFGGSAFGELRAFADELKYAAGRVIFNEGDTPDGMYLVLDGVVLVVRPDEAGDEQIVRVIQARQSFGELGLLVGTARNATVKAGTDVKLLRITLEQLQALEAEKPAISTLVYKVLARTLAEQWMRGGEWVGRQRAS